MEGEKEGKSLSFAARSFAVSVLRSRRCPAPAAAALSPSTSLTHSLSSRDSLTVHAALTFRATNRSLSLSLSQALPSLSHGNRRHNRNMQT